MAMLMRQRGYKTDWQHDLLLSDAMDQRPDSILDERGSYDIGLLRAVQGDPIFLCRQ
jgi:hypothetical protein